LSRLVGRSDAPHYKDSVVVLEEVGEPWYRCDRALTHLFSASDLMSAKALVFGSFEGCEAGTVERLIERCRDSKMTCLSGAPVGHGAANHCFIWGETARYAQGDLQLCGDKA
jgi:muramoyltetrapeptide carboxypeptidase